MRITTELKLIDFGFWSGAKDHKFTYEELEDLESIIEELCHEKTITETDINDLFWFEEQFLCECLGIDFSEYLER